MDPGRCEASHALTELDDWQDEMEKLLMTERGQNWWREVFLLLVSAMRGPRFVCPQYAINTP